MSDPAAINYQPLKAMKGAYSAVLAGTLRHGGRQRVILIVFVIVEILLALSAFSLFIVCLILYFSYLGTRVSSYKNNAWQMFAAANGWPLDASTPLAELTPLSLLQFGHSPIWSPVIQAQLGPVTCDLFLYDCVTGSDKNQQLYHFTVARVALPAALPHLLLLSKKGARVQRDLADGQTLQLEGDFDDYFKLQIEKNQQIDALAVLTPEVMQALVSYDKTEDIEILNNDLYFILGGDKRDTDDVKSLIQGVLALSERIIENIRAVTVPPPAPTAPPVAPPVPPFAVPPVAVPPVAPPPVAPPVVPAAAPPAAAPPPATSPAATPPTATPPAAAPPV